VPANRACSRCNELQRMPASGGKPVRASLRALVAFGGNGLSTCWVP
jgi:hypothetical protein